MLANKHSQSVVVFVPPVALGGWRPAERRRGASAAPAAVLLRRRRRERRGLVPAQTTGWAAPTPRRGRTPHLVTAIASGASSQQRGKEVTIQLLSGRCSCLLG